MRNRKSLAGAFTISATTALLLAAAPASAQSLDAMQGRLEALERQVEALKSQINEARNEASAVRKEAREAKTADTPDVRVKWKGAPEFSSKDGSFKMKIRGRVFADAAFIDQDESVTAPPDIDATEFRAARLGIEGVVFKDVKYKFEVDFAGDEVEAKDAYMQYKGWPVAIALGQFKTPNSLEEQTSSRYITFMERAAITDAFGLARQIGARASYAAENWTVAAGVFRGGSGVDAADEGETYAARATFAPKILEDGIVHLGASVRHRTVGSDQDLLRYRQRPHLHLADRFVATPEFADKDTLVGFEMAGVMGPFSVQGEYMRLGTHTAAAGDAEPTFDGWYVDASWFITGESRNYDAGGFGRVKVRNPVFEGGMGAWQVALRYDTIDLSDEGVLGGVQDTWIVGLNWHLNNYTRIMVNYNQSDVDGGANDGAKIKGLGLRAQVDW